MARWAKLANVLEQQSRRHLQRSCDADEVQQPHVPLATLDASEVRPVHPGAVREFLLRHAEPFALCAHPATEAMEVCLGHGMYAFDVMPIGLQPMSIMRDFQASPFIACSSAPNARYAHDYARSALLRVRAQAPLSQAGPATVILTRVSTRMSARWD